jgi:hypothetical protein
MQTLNATRSSTLNTAEIRADAQVSFATVTTLPWSPNMSRLALQDVQWLRETTFQATTHSFPF